MKPFFDALNAAMSPAASEESARITRRCTAPKLSGTPYRAELAKAINGAADMRRRGLKGLCRNWIDLARRGQHEAQYWQPIP